MKAHIRVINANTTDEETGFSFSIEVLEEVCKKNSNFYMKHKSELWVREELKSIHKWAEKGRKMARKIHKKRFNGV